MRPERYIPSQVDRPIDTANPQGGGRRASLLACDRVDPAPSTEIRSRIRLSVTLQVLRCRSHDEATRPQGTPGRLAQLVRALP